MTARSILSLAACLAAALCAGPAWAQNRLTPAANTAPASPAAGGDEAPDRSETDRSKPSPAKPAEADRSAFAPGPSFDCARAAQSDEKAVCADPQLAAIDRLVAEAYGGWTPYYGDKRTIGRQLAKDRSACGSDTACIAAVMVNALGTYGATPPWAEAYAEALIGRKADAKARSAGMSAEEALPERVGDCAATSIKDLTTRFGEPLDGAEDGAGSAVELANGGYGVSYGVEDALAASEKSQAVVTCLMSIPRDCPAEDGRGRFYYSLNVATQTVWILPDASHMCGGA